MKKLLLIVIGLVSLTLTGCGFIETGNVGVRTQFGKIQSDPEGPGFYTAILSELHKFTTKETFVTINGLTPRAKDNLTLKDLDATIYYTVNPAMVPHFVATHSGMSVKVGDDDFYRAGYVLVDNVARGVVMDQVANFDSLTLHKNREALESGIRNSLQAQLDLKNPGFFQITRVVIRNIQTDPAVEESIRRSVQVQKDIETATKQVEVKEQEADANEKLARSLTPAFLQHEYIEAISKCAGNKNCTLVVAGPNTLLNLHK